MGGGRAEEVAEVEEGESAGRRGEGEDAGEVRR